MMSPRSLQGWMWRAVFFVLVASFVVHLFLYLVVPVLPLLAVLLAVVVVVRRLWRGY